MAAAAILDFQILKFLTVGTFKKFELHQCAKKPLEPRPIYGKFPIFEDGATSIRGQDYPWKSVTVVHLL